MSFNRMNPATAINIFNIPAGGDVDDGPVCGICHDSLSTAQTYKLPECQHEFHTHCIVTWFRHHASEPALDNGNDPRADAPCPYCMHRGVNNNTDTVPGGELRRCLRRGLYYRSSRVIDRERILRKYAREHPGSAGADAIMRVATKLRDARQALTEARKSYTALKAELKEAPTDYYASQKRLRATRRKLYAKGNQYRAAARALLDFPVIPLIIPLPIDIN